MVLGRVKINAKLSLINTNYVMKKIKQIREKSRFGGSDNFEFSHNCMSTPPPPIVFT